MWKWGVGGTGQCFAGLLTAPRPAALRTRLIFRKMALLLSRGSEALGPS